MNIELQTVISLYRNAFNKHGNSPSAVLVPKGRQNDRFKLLTKHFKKNNLTILDFGCGLGSLYSFLQQHFSGFEYTGVDIVNEFINENKKNHKYANFNTIESYSDINKQYDYIVCSGTFNICYLPKVSNESYLFSAISHLFKSSNIALSLDFMHDEVDFQQKSAYHQNIMRLYSFVTKNLSKRIVIDQSVFPYECTVTIFKNQSVLRPDNLYEEYLQNTL